MWNVTKRNFNAAVTFNTICIFYSTGGGGGASKKLLWWGGGGGRRKKSEIGGGHTIFKLHSSKFPQPPLPHKKWTVPYTSQKYHNCTTLYYPFFVPLSSDRLRKPIKNKVVAVAFERCSLARGSKYSDLTWKLLAFWKTGRWGEVVAYLIST